MKGEIALWPYTPVICYYAAKTRVWQRQENRRENKNSSAFVMHVFKLEGAYFQIDQKFMLKVLKPVQ
jgi:hypothetical protein